MIIKKKKIEQEPEKPIQAEQINSIKKSDKKEEVIDLFDLDNIDFKQRNERRRGDRRRGFRRVDDRNLISRAREEAEAIREAAAKEGYQEGLEQSKEDIEALRGALSEVINAKQAVFDKILPEILSISVDIAKKIIKNELTQDVNLLSDSVMEILKNISKEEPKITIKVNPHQVSLLKTEVPEMTTKLGLEAKVMIIPDETITEGGCIVTTANGIVDATIETQLSIICEALKEV